MIYSWYILLYSYRLIACAFSLNFSAAMSWPSHVILWHETMVSGIKKCLMSTTGMLTVRLCAQWQHFKYHLAGAP